MCAWPRPEHKIENEPSHTSVGSPMAKQVAEPRVRGEGTVRSLGQGRGSEEGAAIGHDKPGVWEARGCGVSGTEGLRLLAKEVSGAREGEGLSRPAGWLNEGLGP